MRLLLVEDSVRLQELLAETLRSAGYSLDIAGTAAEFKSNALAIAYDLMVVDLGLPDGDGLAAIRELRGEGVRAPVLVITARGTIDDRISGLDSGADDYMIKPFNHAELLARVRALLRRSPDVGSPVLTVGNTTWNEAAGEIVSNGQPVDLRPSERRVLTLLLRKAGTVITKGALEEAMSEIGREISPNAIEVLVSRVRRALAAAGSDLSIETVRGEGYILRKPV